MTVFEKNLEVLAEHYPEMDKMIKDAQENQEEPMLEILEETSYDGEKILKIKKENKICYLNGKRDTKEMAKKWVETLGKLPRNTPILMMGVGNFSYLKELSEKMEESLTIVIYEPSLQIFLKFLEMTDLQKWMEKHLIVFWVDGLEGMDARSMRDTLVQVLKYEMLDYTKYFVLPNYEVLFPEETVRFVKMCRDVALKALSGYETNNIFAGVMVKNLFANARYLCDGYKTTQLIEVIPRDIPGIVVAAGPSLNKNIKELKKAKGKAFICAVDTAIKPLIREGIIPDMFAVIDALKPVELVEMEEARDIPLLSTLNAAPEVLDYHTGMKFFFNEGYQFAEDIFRKSGHKMGDVSSGGSVATNIFSLLYKIGIETIILVGQDLAYTGNKSYADGTFKDVIEEEDTSRFMMVEGNYEEKVPTQLDLKLFIDWYNMYIDRIKERDENFRVINATEGGAKIQNTELMTLKEAIEEVCTKEVDIRACLEKLPPMLNDEAREWTIEYLKGLSEEFRKVKKETRKMKKLYQKLDKISDKKNIDKKEYLSILKRIEKQREAVEGVSVFQLISITMSNAHYTLLGEQHFQEKSLQKEGKEIAEMGIAYVEDATKCAAVFEKYSEEMFGDLS
ncbi:MAG: motility associated factor glycosyltransferase family protein [Lachnospiraceae bacterium]|nr:motility associated factor glycosyltransferase family protein [Lachnospiraceae bacterium]